MSQTNNNNSNNHCLQPTAADQRFDQWCDRRGIVRIGVQTVTTPKSLGGRGLFAVRPLKRGTVVASIPAELVIVAEQEEWQVSLTKKVMEELKDEKNEWIQSWRDSGALELEALLASEEDNAILLDSFVESMAGIGRITREGAKQDVQSRLENFKRRLELLTQTGLSRSDVAKWYALTLSRSSYLGKDWNYASGIVPFFDMLNHCHDARHSNTDLMTFGDCIDKMRSTEDKNDDKSAKDVLERKDMLLVLTKDVDEGHELLTQYATDIEKEETQLKLWIQYGIPPP